MSNNDKISNNGEISTNHEITLKDKVVSVLFVLYFFGSLGAALYLSDQKMPAPYMLVVIAQVFVIVGSVCTYKAWKKEHAFDIVIIAPVAGLLAIIWSVGLLIDEVKPFFESTIPHALAFGLSLSGVVIFFTQYPKVKHLIAACTIEVQATCKAMKSHVSYSSGNSNVSHGPRTLYCPVFTFHYCGQTYDVCDYCYSRGRQIPVGETHTIKINPEDPTEFMDPSVSYSMQYGMGIIPMIAGGLVFVFLVLKPLFV